MADTEMKYPVFHMVFMDEKFREDTNVISNNANAQMNGPGKSSVCLDKPEDSQSLSSESVGHRVKRKRSSNLSESLPEKKRPKTWSPKESQGSVQRVQLRSDLKAKTPMSSPTVATAPKATSSQGEKATGSKDTVSTASDAIPSTSSGSGPFRVKSDMETITYHSVASSLDDKIYKNRCAIGSEILEGHVAWQVNVQYRLITKTNKDVPICEVGFWTDQLMNRTFDNKIFTLNIAALPNNILSFLLVWQGTRLSSKELTLEDSETANVKIAFAWSPSKKMVLIYIDGKNPLKWEEKLASLTENKICPMFILGDTGKNEAVITVNLKVDTEIESSLKCATEEWTAPQNKRVTRRKGEEKGRNTKPK